MDSLKLKIAHRAPEAVDFEIPTGLVWIERGPQRAALYTPDEIDPAQRYPLLTVLQLVPLSVVRYTPPPTVPANNALSFTARAFTR